MKDDRDKAKKYRHRVKHNKMEREWYEDTIPARIAQCADCYGVTVQAVTSGSLQNLLTFFLSEKRINKITSKHIAKAIAIDRRWSAFVMRKESYQQNKPEEKDHFGAVRGSVAYALNKAILDKGARDLHALIALSGKSKKECVDHLRELRERNHIVKKEKRFVLRRRYSPKH